MRISVGTKLICTYLAVIALTVAPALGLCYYLKHVRRNQTHVLNVAQPTVAAAKGIREGLHESSAGLRGYIAIGGEHFRTQRLQGQKRAQGSLKELDGLTRNAAAEERQLLDQLRRELSGIEAIHRAMESAPRQLDEVPAFQKLAGDSTPLGERMLAASSALIETESKLEKTPQRQKLLEELTGLLAALHGGLMEMHSYLTTAEERHIKNFADQWQNLGAGLTALAAKRRMFTPEQNRQFNHLQQLVGQFQPLPDRLFAMRKSQSWNVAQQRVKDEAGPREAQAEALLAQLIQRSQARAQQAQQTLQAQSAWLETLAVGGPGVAAIFGIFVGFVATRRIVAARAADDAGPGSHGRWRSSDPVAGEDARRVRPHGAGDQLAGRGLRQSLSANGVTARDSAGAEHRAAADVRRRRNQSPAPVCPAAARGGEPD